MSKAKEIIEILRENSEGFMVTVETEHGPVEAEVVNPADLYGETPEDAPFWPHTYVIGFPLSSYVVNAEHEQAAMDEFIDWAEEHAPGYLMSPEEEPEDEEGVYIRGGNHGRMLSEDPGFIDEIDPTKLIDQFYLHRFAGSDVSKVL